MRAYRPSIGRCCVSSAPSQTPDCVRPRLATCSARRTTSRRRRGRSTRPGWNAPRTPWKPVWPGLGGRARIRHPRRGSTTPTRSSTRSPACASGRQPTRTSSRRRDRTTLALVQAPRAAVESVRVAVDKLDALLAQAGELAVTHLRVRQRQSELRTLRDEADASRREWRNTRGLRAGLRRGRSTEPPDGGDAASCRAGGAAERVRCSNASTSCQFSSAATRPSWGWSRAPSRVRSWQCGCCRSPRYPRCSSEPCAT